MLIDELNNARLIRPFEVLGLQPDRESGSGHVLRAWLPGARAVKALTLKGKEIGELKQVEGDGLFELHLDKVKEPFHYKFSVTYQDSQLDIIDPYQFRDEAYYGLNTMNEDPANIYKTLGAQLIEVEVDGVKVTGTKFAVYAPSATCVSVIGDFNFWDGRRHPMARSLLGHWVLFVPGLGAGLRYKFEIKDPQGNRLPHKADPVGFYHEQYPSFASIISDQHSYTWHDQAWQKSQLNNKLEQPLSIYELHFGSWRRDGEGKPLSYRAMAKELMEYVKAMGYTHIELMPIMEHPFSGSWGYQPTGLFAPTSRYGTIDDFKYFVDTMHQNGIGVILDWVPAHFPTDAFGLARFDGTCLYEYEDPRRGWHPDWNSLIYDFGRDTVRRFLIASALIWLDYYHIDGLRVDAVASMLYWDYSRKAGEWVPNVDGGNINYEAVSFIKWFNEEVYKKYPHAMTIAEESTAFTGVSRPTFTGGLGFGFKWNMGWMHDSLQYMSTDPFFRKYHHGEMSFSMIYAYNENFILSISHDEVTHGKHSLLYKMPGDEWQQAANLRAYLSFQYAHPGKKLNFMGTEFGQTSEWNVDSQLDWWLLKFDKHRGVHKLIRDLNELYRKQPALWRNDYDPKCFYWLDVNDADHSVFAMLRSLPEEDDEIIAVANFTPVPYIAYRLGVPKPGTYEVIFNSDDKQYWGSGYGTGNEDKVASNISWQNQYHSIVLDLPPLATILVKRVKK
ncbi:MAG: 1,4-alpha-glucan branching protein GlgB [Succinivibrio sp.]|nr:1,4-alpha-glucan branching protein GlgB [Succinivibrio sp.]